MRQVWLAHEQGLVDPEAALKDTQKEGQGVDDSFMDEIDSQ